MANGISRRHFFFGTLLAGVIPRGGFGSVASLKALGYQSPNEKMNMQQGSEQVREAGLPKGMGTEVDHVELIRRHEPHDGTKNRFKIW
jgi:hypothetical protein